MNVFVKLLICCEIRAFVNECANVKKHNPCRRVCSNKAIVPADLQSAGIEYKDFSIRLLPIF